MGFDDSPQSYTISTPLIQHSKQQQQQQQQKGPAATASSPQA
jgi:hypothetical protein